MFNEIITFDPAEQVGVLSEKDIVYSESHESDIQSTNHKLFTARPDLSERHMAALGRLRDLLQLPENWDSYGALPIKLGSALAASELIILLVGESTPMPDIVPTPKGNIQLEWHGGGIDLEVETVSQISLRVLFEDNNVGEEWEGDLHTDLRALTRFVQRLPSCL